MLLGMGMVSAYGNYSWNTHLNNGIVSYYKLNETSGTLAQDSLGLNNGTIIGAVSVNTPGIVGSSYNFTGSSGKVNLTANNPTPTVNFTICLWANLTTALGTGRYAYNSEINNRTNVLFGSDNKITAQLGNPAINIKDTVDYTNSTWYHVCVSSYNTTSGRNGSLYVNGVLKNSAMWNGDSITSTTTNIGGSGSNFWLGLIDEVGIWNRTLNSNEIGRLYNAGIGTTYNTVFGQDCGISPTDGCTISNTVNFNQGDYYNSIIINASNLVVNCNNSNLSGDLINDGFNITQYQVNVTIKNCRMSNYWHGIYAKGLNNSILQDNIINYTGSVAVWLEKGSNRNVIERNIIDNANTGIGVYGISLESRDNIIRNNSVLNSTYNSIDLFAISNYNNITNNYVWHSNYNGVGIMVNRNSNHNYVSLNNVSSTKADGIQIAGLAHGGLTELSQYNTIDNNTVTNAGAECIASPASCPQGIIINWYASNNIIKNNFVYNTTGNGIEESLVALNNSYISNIVNSSRNFGIEINPFSSASLCNNIMQNDSLGLDTGSNILYDCGSISERSFTSGMTFSSLDYDIIFSKINLAGWWRFLNYSGSEDNATYTADYSGNGYGLTINGSSVTGGGVYFNGIPGAGGYGLDGISAPLLFPENFTLYVKVKPGLSFLPSSSGLPGLIATRQGTPAGYVLAYQLSTRKIAFGVDNSTSIFTSINSNTLANDSNQVYGIVAKFNGVNITLYINGTQESTKFISNNTLNYGSKGFNVGRWRGTNETYNGTFYEVRVYNTSLSDDEISKLNKVNLNINISFVGLNITTDRLIQNEENVTFYNLSYSFKGIVFNISTIVINNTNNQTDFGQLLQLTRESGIGTYTMPPIQNYSINASNLTSALIYYQNNTPLGILNNSILLNFNGTNYVYLLNNYNITEGVSRAFDPIWISSSTATSKHLASNLSQAVNATSIFTGLTDCYHLTGITSSDASNGITQVYSAPDSCQSSTQATLTLQIQNTSDQEISFAYFTGGTGGGGGSSGGDSNFSYNETIICKNSYNFIIDHADTKGIITYTEAELLSLSNKITNELNTLISTETIRPYVNDYVNKCSFYKKLPFSTQTPEKNTTTSYTFENCDYKIDKEVLGFDLDNSIKFNEIQTGISCQAISTLKYLVSFKELNGGQDYAVNGIKIYLLIVGLFGLIMIYLGKSNKKLYKLIKAK